MKRLISGTFILLIIFSSHSFAQQQNLWTTYTTAEGLANNDVRAIVEASDGTLWFGTYGGGVSYFQQGIWKTLTVVEGLVSNNIYTGVESSNGALWFGTDKGVCRYKHGIWSTYNTSDGLVSNSVTTIFESSDGAMWFGTANGVSHFHQGIWTTLDTTDGLVSNHVSSIIESFNGAIWFATNKGVSCYFQQNWQNFTRSDGLTSDGVNAILQSSDGALWFGTNNGVTSYHNGLWKNFFVPGMRYTIITSIAESSDGVLWFGSVFDGVTEYHQDQNTTNIFKTKDGLADNHIYSIIESSDGTLWFGTPKGVNRYQYPQQFWTKFTTADGLAANEVFSIIEASDGALWFGVRGTIGHGGMYSGDVSRYYKAKWSQFTAFPGLIPNMVYTILESSGGAIWFRTFRGLSRYHKDNWTTFDTTNGLAANLVNVMCEHSDGSLWFGTDKGVSRYQNGDWTTFTTADSLAGNSVRAIMESSDGSLWLASNGVNRFHNGMWSTYDTTDGLASNFVNVIFECSDGSLWFGTWEGVSRFYNEAWTTFTIADGLVNNNILSILESVDHSLWFRTYEGVSRYHHGVWTAFSTANVLSNNYIKTMIESTDGSLWFATYGGGVCRYYQDRWTTFTTANDLVDNHVNTIIESSDGALWFGTLNGVSRTKPDRKPPNTLITLGPENEEIIGTANLLFAFSAKDYRSDVNLPQYSWVIVDSNHFVRYGDSLQFQINAIVQPTIKENGNYIIKVWARDVWSNIDPSPATRTFTVDITPPTITILSPKVEDIIAGEVMIIGSAYDNSPIQDFSDYELSYALTKEDSTRWLRDRFFYQKTTTDEIRDDTLAIWNTSGLLNATYWLHLSARDKLGHISHDFVPVEVVKACQLIDARQGGYLCADSRNIEIYIPPNAIPKDKQINVKDFSLQQINPIDHPQITLLNICFEITPKEIQLSKPGTLSLIYPDSLVNGKNEDKFALYSSYDGKSNWQRLGGSVNLEENKLTTSFKHLGVFALYEDLSIGERAGILNVNSQPRIFSPQGGGYDTQTTISFELGKESNVTIKIYNPAGRLVRVLKENKPMSHGNNVVYWGGKDQQGEFCVSGLYIVTIQAEEKIATKTVVVLNK